MKIGAVVQARTASTRLPRKVLKELPYGSGITVLEQVLRRLQRSKRVEQIVVATTTDPSDEPIAQIAHRTGTASFRGSIDDVLQRFYFAAQAHQLDVVVRITSDCPCIDPEVVDLVIDEHLRSGADFTTNCLQRTFLHGVDTEVLTFSALETAYREATQPYERQHVCPFIYKTAPERFKITIVRAPAPLAAPGIRATLDTSEDYALLCALFEALHASKPHFNAQDVIALLRERPWLKLINGKVIHKRVLSTTDEEIREALRVLGLQDLHKARGFLETMWSTMPWRDDCVQRDLAVTTS